MHTPSEVLFLVAQMNSFPKGIRFPGSMALSSPCFPVGGGEGVRLEICRERQKRPRGKGDPNRRTCISCLIL